MEENNVVKVKLTTAIIMILVGVVIGLCIWVYILKKVESNIEVANNINNISSNSETAIENKIDNSITNTNTNLSTNEQITSNSSEKNTEGKSLIQFDTKFFELKEMAKEYRLSKNIQNFKDFDYDLDGDGKIDKITIENSKNEDGNFIFKLNGNEFSTNRSMPEIYIADLNEDDNKMEVVIFDLGQSDDPNYTIYVKENNNMKQIGNIFGEEFSSDKNGNVLVKDFYNGRMSPEIYFEYYNLKNGKLEKKSADIEKIKNKDFKVSHMYFSKEYSNIDKLYSDENMTLDPKSSLKRADIEELDENVTFKILSVESFKEDDEVREYKIKVKLSDGREGYVFYIQFAG